MLRSIRPKRARRPLDASVDPTDARSAEDDRTKPHGRDQNRFRRRECRQTERLRPGGLSDRPQEPTPRRFARRGIRPRGANGLASCGSALDGAGSDGRSTGTGQDRQVESVTVGSVKNRAVLSAPFASLIAGEKDTPRPDVVLDRNLQDGAAQESDSGRFPPVVLSDRSTRRGPLARSVGWSVPALGYLGSTRTTDLHPEAVASNFRRG
jgi:hypothetical protein